MESTNASIEDIDRIEEIATAAFKSTVYYAKPILTTHVEHFPQGFLLAREGKEILGFICGLGARETSIQGWMYEKESPPRRKPHNLHGTLPRHRSQVPGKGHRHRAPETSRTPLGNPRLHPPHPHLRRPPHPAL